MQVKLYLEKALKNKLIQLLLHPMKRWLMGALFFSLLFAFTPERTHAQEEELDAPDPLDEIFSEPNPDYEEPVEQEQPVETRDEVQQAAKETAAEGGAQSRKVALDAAITLNYVFADSPESFTVKYHFHIDGAANADTAVIKGEADINSEVEGFLAKWPSGECKLLVTVPKVPFELSFKKAGESSDANLSLRWKGNIIETWKSSCTFTEPAKPFETTGNPEKWLTQALNKARPPLRAIKLKLEPGQTASTSFVVKKQTIQDPPIGSAEIEGTGLITVTNGSAEEE